MSPPQEHGLGHTKRVWWLLAGKAACRAGLGTSKGAQSPSAPASTPLPKPLAAGEAPLSANSNYCRPELQGEESCAGNWLNARSWLERGAGHSVSSQLLVLIVVPLEC